MEIEQILKLIEETEGCTLRPKFDTHLPTKELPDDLKYFFSKCDGADLFLNKTYGISIVGQSDFKNANITFYPSDDVIWEELDGDISNDWYIIAQEQAQSQFITIDLNSERFGNCYDSFLEIHADPDFSPVIAESFSDLLLNLLKSKGENWYWNEENFESLGSAYE